MHLIYKKICGSIHLLSSIFITFYGLVIPKNQYDKLYLLSNNLLLISWILNNGHCLITYYLTENKNNSDCNNFDDYYVIFNYRYNNIINNYVFSTIFINTISIYNVYTRNNYSKLGTSLSCLSYMSYRLMLSLKN